MPVLLGFPILAVLFYSLLASGSWNSVIGLSLASALMVAGFRWLRRHTRYSRPTLIGAGLVSYCATLVSFAASGPHWGEPPVSAFFAFALGILFSLGARFVGGEPWEELAMLSSRGRGPGVTDDLDWSAAEAAPVCPRCQNTGTFLASTPKPCPAYHRPNTACWMCRDTGHIHQNEEVACVHLAGSPAACAT